MYINVKGFLCDIIVCIIKFKKEKKKKVIYILVMFGFGLCMKCLIIDVKYKFVGK